MSELVTSIILPRVLTCSLAILLLVVLYYIWLLVCPVRQEKLLLLLELHWVVFIQQHPQATIDLRLLLRVFHQGMQLPLPRSDEGKQCIHRYGIY